jgi:hypothetical protein
MKPVSKVCLSHFFLPISVKAQKCVRPNPVMSGGSIVPGAGGTPQGEEGEAS